MNQLYLLGDVAKRLNVRPHRVAYLFLTRRLAEPSRIGNRRMFSESDCERVAAALGRVWTMTERKGEHE